MPAAEMTPAQPTPTTGRTPWAMVCAWAAFLACSWTWCIGMFLPVLIARDFGPLGFWAFALPNVIGAAAMGWILSRRSSQELVDAHRPAATAFSLVTIAFHMMFVAWLLADAWYTPWVPIAALSVLLVLTAAFTAMPARVQAAAAAVVTLATAVIAVGLLWLGSMDSVPSAEAQSRLLQLRHPPGHTLPLAAVCVLGFALCPYLDLTFHRARAQTGRVAGPLAFSLGFGVLFFGFILLTSAYRGVFLWGDHTLGVLLLAHILVQAAYTLGVHIRACAEQSCDRPIHPAGLTGVVLLIAGILMAWPLGKALGPIDAVAHLHRGMRLGELVYRGFMGFYGLIFPAYVWLCVIPARGRGFAAPTRARLVALGLSVAAAAPCYWLGFFRGEMWWLLAGVAIVLVARPVAGLHLLLMARRGTLHAAA